MTDDLRQLLNDVADFLEDEGQRRECGNVPDSDYERKPGRLRERVIHALSGQLSLPLS